MQQEFLQYWMLFARAQIVLWKSIDSHSNRKLNVATVEKWSSNFLLIIGFIGSILQPLCHTYIPNLILEKNFP